MKKYIFSLVLVKAALLLALTMLTFSSCQKAQMSQTAIAQTATLTPTPQISDYNINRPTSEPYVGDLSIFESEDRAKNLQIDHVMDILKITEGKSVADIGAGGGWFSMRAAKKVGAAGKVYAVEINPEYIKAIEERAGKENLANIQTVLGTESDPKLAENSIDAALILKTYHEIAEPIAVLRNLKKAMRKDSLLGIIDRNGTGGDHGIDMNKVIEELKRAGFEKAADYDFVKPDGMDYFLVFKVSGK